MIEIFDNIYKNKLWECQGVLSGAGSHPYSAKDYIEYLYKFKDTSVLDLGCGDLSIYDNNFFFKKYIGVDIVDIKKYKDVSPHIIINSSIEKFNYQDYNFDLILIKDVFQHLNNKRISIILDLLLSLNTQLLITNDFSHDLINSDCENGDHHYLNMELNPFNLKIREKYNWRSHFDDRLKQSVLI